MGNEHRTANTALKRRATARAEELAHRALPALRSRYDKGQPNPEVTVALDGAVSQEIYDLAEGDVSFADYIGRLIFDEAAKLLSTRLDGHKVDVYREGHNQLSSGDVIKVTVKVRP